jgi:hypothetical protein
LHAARHPGRNDCPAGVAAPSSPAGEWNTHYYTRKPMVMAISLTLRFKYKRPPRMGGRTHTNEFIEHRATSSQVSRAPVPEPVPVPALEQEPAAASLQVAAVQAAGPVVSSHNRQER